MGELIFYIVCAITLGGWLTYKVKTDKTQYIDGIEEK